MADLDGKFAMAAVTHLCSSQDWPPSIAQIRKMSLYLSRGETSPPSPWEAWERAVRGESSTDIEKRCLTLVGGTWQVKHSENQEVLRSQFIKAYSEFMHRHDSEQCAIKEVKQLAEASKPAPTERMFPPPSHEYDHTRDPGFKRATPEEVRELMKGLLSEHESAILREAKLKASNQ
jgi:hypothetical protein